MSPLDGNAKPRPKVVPITRKRPWRGYDDAVDREAAAAWRRETLGQPFPLLSSCDPEPGSRYFEAHHVIPQQTLRRKARDLGLPERELLWDARIGLRVSRRRHERHHAGVEPIVWADLPTERRYYVSMFAVSYGLEPWLERHMPGYAP